MTTASIVKYPDFAYFYLAKSKAVYSAVYNLDMGGG